MLLSLAHHGYGRWRSWCNLGAGGWLFVHHLVQWGWGNVQSNVVGFELVELLPFRVSGYETVLNSGRIVIECWVGITMRKRGIVDEHYLAPLTVDDEKR